MKRVKLMLVSLSVLAVVGGALAFNTKGSNKFCTALPDNGACPNSCPNFNSKGLATTGVTKAMCTTFTSGSTDTPCSSAVCDPTPVQYRDNQ